MLGLKLNQVSKRGPGTIQFFGSPWGIWYFCELPREMSYFRRLIVILSSVLSFITKLVSWLTSMKLWRRPVGTERYVDLKCDPKVEQVEGGVLMRKCKMNTSIYRLGVIPRRGKNCLTSRSYLKVDTSREVSIQITVAYSNVASVIDACSNILTVKTVLSLPRWHGKENGNETVDRRTNLGNFVWRIFYRMLLSGNMDMLWDYIICKTNCYSL